MHRTNAAIHQPIAETRGDAGVQKYEFAAHPTDKVFLLFATLGRNVENLQGCLIFRNSYSVL